MLHLGSLPQIILKTDIIIICFCSFFVSASTNEIDEDFQISDDDPDVDPYNVREEGCPMVSERDKLDISKLSATWLLPFASLNWLADIGMSLYNRSVKMSQITTICPRIVITDTPLDENRNASLSLKFVCPKLKGVFDIWCWYQSPMSKSKFICWNNKEERDMYLMVAATNHENWVVIIRCSAQDEGRPAEGMSWALLSKSVDIETDISDVLFGLLEGYGFDVEEFRTQLMYDTCPSPSDSKVV